MPILEVEVVLGAGEELAPGWARGLADAAGEVLGAEPGTCWVRLRGLPRGQYAESGGAPAELLPVFVALLLAAHPPATERAGVARRLTDALAAVLDRPAENLHLVLEPPGAGRVAFGGRLRDQGDGAPRESRG